MSISTTTISAVDALLKWKQTQLDSNNPQLFPQDDFIYLILTLKKIPQKGSTLTGARTNPNKIPLPNPLFSPSSSELCLIIDDRPTSNLTSKLAKQKIKSDNISVTKVIKLSKLRTDYKPFEAKRKLCDSYEMFFADKRVIPLLPKLLGKQFFKKKKLPLGVDLTHKNWKEQIERGCSSGLLFFRTGTCSVIRVAKVSMERDEIVKNVRAAVEGVLGFVSKGLGGVRSLHLKFSDSVALPLYQALPDIRLKIEGFKDKVQEKDVEGELMEVEEVGKKKKSKKNRIHEFDHDEVGEIGGDLVSDEIVVEKVVENEAKKSVKGKKRKGNVVEEDDVNAKPSDKVAKTKVVEKVVENETKKSVKGKKRKGNVVEEDDVNTKPSDKVAKTKGESGDEGLMDVKSGKKSVEKKKRKGDVVKEDDVNTKPNDEVAKKKGKNADESLVEVKSGKKIVEKKRKGDAVEGDDVNVEASDKVAKKKGKKQDGDSGKKEKKKGRSVSRV